MEENVVGIIWFALALSTPPVWHSQILSTKALAWEFKALFNMNYLSLLELPKFSIIKSHIFYRTRRLVFKGLT
jgi:hypothetical protein